MCVCLCVCVCVVQLLWEKEREELSLTEKQTFIDLGCGNGLLVYLLTSEGVSHCSGTSLIWTPMGQKKVSFIVRCPHFRG